MRVKISLSKGFFLLFFPSLLMALCLTGCAQDSSILDNGGNKELEFSVRTCAWSNSNSHPSDSKIDSRATPISGNTFDTTKSFNVIADVSKGGNWSTEVKNEIASYSTVNNIWQTSNIHYWPKAASTMNFYAYYPTSISSKVTHNAGSAPVLSYTVPDNAADQIDILTSLRTGVAGDSYNQIPVDFKHIFAAIQFSIGSNGMPSGTITGVTLNNIQYKGTYSLDGTWIPNTTDKKSFSQTVSALTSTGTAITSGSTTFIMMPQTLSSDANITITYSNGGTLTKAISGTWEAGKTYTYNLSKIIPVANFDYTGNVQTYKVPITGTYKLEVWGASGATYEGVLLGGNGACSYGIIELARGQDIYICVGGAGNWGTYTGGGYNGGGNSGGIGSSGGGGGATSITKNNNRGILSNYVNNQNEVIIVAGGGGGGDSGGNGGNGGGTAGGDVSGAMGGNQTSGYAFGKGESPSINSDGAGGGGGWFGGLSTVNNGAGGGSGYLCTLFLNETTGMKNGVRTGNGYARITFVSAN